MAQDSAWQKWLRIREARIQIDAHEVASADPEVVRWRDKALDDRGGLLLRDEEVEGWIAPFEDAPSPRIRPPTLPLTGERWWIESHRASPASTWAPPSGEGFAVYPKEGSILEEGMKLAESLGNRFGWTAPSAARWLLTGFPPTGSPIAEIRSPEGQQEGAQWREVVLRVPVEVPPDAVADLYQSRREAALAGMKSVPFIKNTPISEKTLKATMFAVERSQSGDSWGDVFVEWSKHIKSQRKGKEWGFASPQSFISATRKTYKRLTGRDLQWKRQRGERK